MPKVSDAPALEVEQPFFELGDMHYNVPANVTYVLRNVGDQPLRILDVPQVKVLEGCCPPTPTISSMVITPGRTATIALQFSMHEGMDGPHDFRMQLKTNDPATPSTELGVRSNWVP